GPTQWLRPLRGRKTPVPFMLQAVTPPGSHVPFHHCPDPGGVTVCSPGVEDPGIQRANWNFEARELASDNTIPTGSDLLIISFSDRNFQEHPGRAKSHVNG